MSRLLNFVMFYLGWIACVIGAARGQLWLGPTIVAVWSVVHLSLSPAPLQEARLILAVAIFGFATETLQASAGLYTFPPTASAAPWLCPLWMAALWMIFATTLNSSMGWLAGRYGLAAALGALFGPVSYLAGARLGAIEFPAHALVSLVGIATTWAIAMPALLWLRDGLTAPLAVRAIVVTLLLITSAPRSSTAAEIEGVHFADQYRRDDVTLPLRCVGLLRYKVLFKGYVAGLYLGDGVAADQALADVPKRLELSYFWSIKGADFGEAGDAILARNLDPEALQRLRPRLEQINALYESVKPSDRYALTYVPGIGTELSLNGRRKGVIPGADFAAAYFRIWLGDDAIDLALRDQLLDCPKKLTEESPKTVVRSDSF
jgi:hypothetical protein